MALVAACLIVASCSPSTSPSGSAAPRTSAAASEKPVAAIPTSEQLIATALAAGSITVEQSLLYRALALYNSPGLPQQFHSSVRDMEAAGALLRDIDKNEATLSAGLLKQLAPYRVRPSDPTSIYNSPPPQAGVNAVLLADVVTTWKSRPAAGGKALVWVKDSPTAADDLTKYAEEVSTVWAAYPGIFTYPTPDQPNDPSPSINPNSAIDIYFVNVGELDPRQDVCVSNPSDPSCALAPGTYGYAPRVPAYHGNKSSGCLVVDGSRSRSDTLDTIAHELAHASQFAYDMDESSWLMESTATWVAFKVMKALKLTPEFQYRWLPQTFNGMDETLTRETNGNEYASWLYFLFASMEKGDGVVTDIWKAAAADGEQGYKAVDQVFPFADHYQDYAVRNWNEDPVTPQYRKADGTFPGSRQPNIRNSTQTLGGTQKDILNVNLPPLASAYFKYDFQDSARDVTFDNYLQGYADAHVWAIQKINGEWKKPEDWTAAAKKRFCRNIPEDDLSSIILVVSNNSTTTNLDVADGPKMSAGTSGCSGWRGTMKATGTWGGNGGMSHGSGTSTFTGVWLMDESFDSGCDPASTDPCPSVYRPTGTISWTWDSHIFKTNGAPFCDVTTSGSLAAGQEKYPERPLQALHFLALDPKHLQYWGGGAFTVPDLKCANTLVGGTIPSSFFEIDQRASTANGTQADGSTCFSTNWQIDTTAGTISGSCWAYNFPNNRQQFEWNLTRVGDTPGS